MSAWHEDDEFWAAIEPALFSSARLAAATSDVDAIVKLLGIAPGSRVLDLCAGPGRHAVEFARRGFRTTGVDRTAEYVERAREAAAAEGVEVEFVREDMRRFVRSRAFDAVVNLNTSFGYFEDEAENKLVAENVRESLKPGGVALIETMGKEILARHLRERWWTEEEGVLLLEHRSITPGWESMVSRWIVVRGGDRREFEVKHRLYSGVEMRHLLAEAGFARVDLFGTLGGAAYDDKAERLVAVALLDGPDLGL